MERTGGPALHRRANVSSHEHMFALQALSVFKHVCIGKPKHHTPFIVLVLCGASRFPQCCARVRHPAVITATPTAAAAQSCGQYPAQPNSYFQIASECDGDVGKNRNSVFVVLKHHAPPLHASPLHASPLHASPHTFGSAGDQCGFVCNDGYVLEPNVSNWPAVLVVCEFDQASGNPAAWNLPSLQCIRMC